MPDEHLLPQQHGPAAAPALTISVATSSADFLALEHPWQELVEASPTATVFMTWEWLSSWWEVFGASLAPWILLARSADDGRLLGAAPFVERTPWPRLPYRELAFMGATAAAGDHHDVLARQGHEEAVAASFADFLHAHRAWDVVALDYFAAGSPLAAGLQARLAHRAMCWETLCPYISLPGAWEEFLAGLSKNARRKLVKPAQYLEQDFAGQIAFYKVQEPLELPPALDDLFALHQACWNARGRPGAFASERLRRFHRRVAEKMLARGWLNLHGLRVLGRTIAVQYGFRFRGRECNYQGGYDPEWGAYSPGMTLFAHVARAAADAGVHEIDLLRGEEAYKHHWTATARRNVRLRLAATLRGSLFVQAFRTYHAARRRYRVWRSAAPAAQRFVVDPSL